MHGERPQQRHSAKKTVPEKRKPCCCFFFFIFFKLGTFLNHKKRGHTCVNCFLRCYHGQRFIMIARIWMWSKECQPCFKRRTFSRTPLFSLVRKENQMVERKRSDSFHSTKSVSWRLFLETFPKEQIQHERETREEERDGRMLFVASGGRTRDDWLGI